MSSAKIFLLSLLSSQAAIAATSVYLHRSATHGALELTKTAEIACRTVIWMFTGIRRKPWIAVHRFHHKVSDTELDPHSPRHAGFWRVQLGGVGLYRRAAKDQLILQKYGKDITDDRWDRLFNRTWLGPMVTICLLTTTIGARDALLTFTLHAFFYLTLQQAVNAWCHPRRAIQAGQTGLVDRPLLAWITAGEGLHKTHHSAPWLHDYSEQAGVFDIGGCLVRGLVRMRLAIPARPPSG